MRIQLDPEFLIDCDEMCCTLVKIRTISAESTRGRAANPENIGKQREEVLGHHGTFEQACRGYLKAKTQGSDATTAEMLISLAEAAVGAIQEAVKGIPRAVLAQPAAK